MLLDILFIYCKLNPDIGYRQGMHEVLAPMLWVISRDSIDPESSDELPEDGPPEQKLIRECFDAQFVEHDTFTVFGIIMQTVKSFYEVGSTTQIAPSPASNTSPIVERSQRIHEVYLRQADPILADHLVDIEILPQIFLIRWIRLLFGREFPLDLVLSVWDVLFAEDPTLDLIDLVCVSMLLRIRQQLLRADYSEALTLLLRYPAPTPFDGPSTFVDDALYLRQHIWHGGGSHIIEKYSDQASENEKGSKKRKSQPAKRVKHVHTSESKGSRSSLSPSRFLQEKGGIDTIIQEAAKGVYSRGEKWGVNKAFRGAVESLQSGTNYPRKQLDGSRWSLDEGAHVPSVSKLAADIKALEQRSKGLAKLLDNPIGELWEQQRQCSEEKEESFKNALSLAIAKIQFVQVYLENPTVPFPVDNHEAETRTIEEHGHEKSDDILESNTQTTHSISSDPGPRPQESTLKNSRVTGMDSEEAWGKKGIAHTDAAPDITVSKVRHEPLPFHHPRPSLAQSSFSWMLGEDQRKSSFVLPAPFPSDKRAAREKADFLFGDGKVKSEGKSLKGKKGEESEDEEVINLGTLKGRRRYKEMEEST
ncbi:MAG: hypothetical protein Q9188_003742 [Gyalolechia gomerana]